MITASLFSTYALVMMLKEENTHSTTELEKKIAFSMLTQDRGYDIIVNGEKIERWQNVQSFEQGLQGEVS